MNQKEVAQALIDTASLLELKGENPFKTRAYHVAAGLLQEFEAPLEVFIEECRAGKIKGIGAQLTASIESLVNDGSLPLLDSLRTEFPAGVLDLMQLAGLGPKKVRALYDELKITTIDELEQACLSNALSKLKGFGLKTQSKLLDSIAYHRSHAKKCRLPQARERAALALEALRAGGNCRRAEICGDLRRVLPVLHCIEILAVPEPGKVLAPPLPDDGGPPIIVHETTEAEFSTALFRHTGSEAHLAKLTQASPGAAMTGDSEAAIYAAHGLAFIPPECREGRGEIELARELYADGKQFRLLELGDIKGILHAHSTYTDGKNTLAEMARRTKELGFEYLGISDHSQSAIYANGLKLDAIRRQHEEIDQLNAELSPFRIFKGIESDILIDGRLDYPDEVLALFDFVIASIHSRFAMGSFEMTERLVQAIENPFTTILAHPTGRLLLEREGYTFQMTPVLEAAAACGVAVEINSNPKRLDLDWEHLDEAREHGVTIAICPDAHSLGNILNIEYGVAVARKGRIEPAHVLNCLSREKLSSHFEARKAR